MVVFEERAKAEVRFQKLEGRIEDGGGTRKTRGMKVFTSFSGGSERINI